MSENKENKEEFSGEGIIDEEVMAAIERKTGKREEEQKGRFFGRSGREFADALYYGTSVPILILVGVFIGWYLTQDESNIVKALGILGGATLGLFWAVFDIIRKEKKSRAIEK